MIQTSSLYKNLLEQGAIQEYKIVVDGIEYLDDAIYDNVILKQQLFSTDTFSVGGFALSTLEVKLRVPTLDIPRNANVKFYYRLTNLEENSEWIKKFNGRVTKRKRYTNDVTTIEAVSKAANYDVFINEFPNVTDEYPADNRMIANTCANHLGLTIDNINDVFDGKNVEFPSEMTVIEVLQNIAAISGGNWIITPDDKLRLVVLNKTNNLYQGEITKPLGVSRMELARNLILKKGQSLTFSYQEYESTTGETPEQLLLYFTDVQAEPNQSVLIDTSEKEASFILEEDFSRVFIYGDFNYATSIERECTISDMLLIENDVLHTYSAFNIVSEESIPPISRVTMYYQDDKAFTSGDDTGSELTIDCQWATQETTNYVLSLYEGYVYHPIQGSGVAIDGAIQLGDHFEYDDGQIQLASKIDYSFTKALTANVDAPLSNEDSYDDPYKQITSAPFKRKVSLGDNYQGVTISRDKGIEMIYSPDGTEENASGKFYADLEKGMAFQYKDIETGIWEDWLYFDKNENIFKLMLKGGDLDTQMVNIVIELNQIMQEIENIHNGNLIYNLNGENDLVGWEGMADLTGRSYTETLTYRDVDTYYDGDGEKEGLRYPDGLYVFDGLTYGMNAMPVDVHNSLSTTGLSFFGESEMRSPVAQKLVDGEYSFKAKLIDFKRTIIKIYEYIDLPVIDSDIQPTYVSTFNFDEASEFIELTLTPQNTTKFIRVGITVPSATVDNHTVFTEMMFNYGKPQNWFQSADDAMAYAKSSIAQLANKIELQAEEIDMISGDLHNAGVEINARDGVTTRGSKFRVLSSDGNETYMEVNENGLFVKNATIEGNLTAGTIAGLLFEGNRVVFPNGELALDSSKDAIMFGSTMMQFKRTSGTSGGTTYYSDNVSIKTTNGEILFGDSAGPLSPTPVTSISGVDAMMLRLIYHPQGLTIGGSAVASFMGGDLRPNITNSYYLGSTSLRFKGSYFNTQPNVSSDIRIKKNILPIDEKFIRMFGEEVKPKTYISVHDGEQHFGYVAQDVERLLYKYISRYGSCKTVKELKEIVTNFSVLHKDETFLSLLYGEIAVIVDAYHRLKNEDLEKRIDTLERNDDIGNNKKNVGKRRRRIPKSKVR